MPADPQLVRIVRALAMGAQEKLATQIVILDVSDKLLHTEIFAVASGTNERQVASIVDAIAEAAKAEGQQLLRVEGKNTLRWVLMDFGDIIFHVQHEEDRVYYSLERLWGDCPVIALDDVAQRTTQ
ncbi:MAG: ribosome silencing factor [Actinomycetaceae bacterium]|nr:ribosome silencing factor [Actinomycetaceae bacterium]